ncbi:uncharacterized protein ATNIH1004_005437 [Aspergillus tanneri]|uniref:Uncharacterized protein n=1 Tax=Aspergillus tanneri TaxID=1220188 RepID=A0A5M9MIE1_9EURO|nr:uncharacterized protein ATNIH1004_005437 [Aspergillus tanneri]KAA8646762.1 hypothetical protein ATNIH1004_005437 [Aspergillus tanneri]
MASGTQLELDSFVCKWYNIRLIFDDGHSSNDNQNVPPGDTRVEIQELRQRLEEEQRRHEQAERSQLEAEEQLKLHTQETPYPVFLNACHVHLFLGLAIQIAKDSSTKGDPANADRKLRPAKIREWTNFPNEPVSIWEDLVRNRRYRVIRSVMPPAV